MTSVRPPGTSGMDIRAIITGRTREKGGLQYVVGGIGGATPAELPEISGWPEQPPWAFNQSEFGVHYHNIEQMRKKYPFVMLYVVRGDAPGEGPRAPWLHADFSKDVFRKFPYAEVPPRFFIPPHNLFERVRAGWKALPRMFLFDVGRGDIFDFGGILQDLARFSIVAMLAREPTGLAPVQGIFEQAEDVEEVVHRLIESFPVIYYPNDEGDFILVTTDDEVVDAFLRNVWWRPTGFLWKLRNLAPPRRRSRRARGGPEKAAEKP